MTGLLRGEIGQCPALATLVSERGAGIWRAIVRFVGHDRETGRIGIRETEPELARPPRAHVGSTRLFNIG